MIDKGISWLLNKFSLSAPQGMYGKQYGENTYWCYGAKGNTQGVQSILLHLDVFKANKN